MRSKTWLAVVYAGALLACLWALSGCASTPAPPLSACPEGESPAVVECLRRENAVLRRQLGEAEADVKACSTLLRECESLGAESR